MFLSIFFGYKKMFDEKSVEIYSNTHLSWNFLFFEKFFF